MFRETASPSGRILPPIHVPPVPLSLEERLSSCEKGIQFLMEESVRSRGMMRLQLQQINQGGGSSSQETAQLRSQLVSTQTQMSSFMRQSTRQAFLEVERERLLTAHEDFSNQVRLDTNIGRVAGELKDLSHRLNQTTHISERQLEDINREVETGAISLKRLAATISSLSTNLNRSEERISSHISLVEERCTHGHETLCTTLTNKAEKWKEEFIGLETRLSGDISELHSLLNAISNNIKELTLATVRRIQQLSEEEVRERNILEKMLLKEFDNARDKFESRWEKIEKSIYDNYIEIQQRHKKFSQLMSHHASSLGILEQQVEAERLRTNHLLLAEVTARKEAVSSLQTDTHRVRADLLKLLNSAHQANQLLEVKLQQLQSSLEQRITLLTDQLQDYRTDCLESTNQLSDLRESVNKELSSLQVLHSLREEFTNYKTELENNFSNLNQRIDSNQSCENSLRAEITSLSNKLLQMKQEHTHSIEEQSSQIHKSQQKLIELNSLIQPLLNTPQAISDLSRLTQQLEGYTRQHNEETIQLHRALQGTQQLFSQKLHLEETARISALTNISNEIRAVQLQLSHPPLYTHPSLNQANAINVPPPKPSTLHIPKQPSLNLGSVPSSYEHLTSISIPSTCTSVSNLFLHTSANVSKLPHSTPKSNSTSLTDLKYTTSPIEGEIRVISSIRSHETQDQKDGEMGGSTETSIDESTGSIADKFQAVTEESGFSPLVHEHVPTFPASPKEGKRENTQSAQDRVLSVIREESETQAANDLDTSHSKKQIISADLPLQPDTSHKQESEEDILSPLPQIRSESSGSFFSRHLSLPDSLGKDKPIREYRRLRTVESVARQSFIKSPEPLKEAQLDWGEEDPLNEWGIYQAIFWLRLKMKWMRPVLRIRERISNSENT
ncbi:hypothetical protein LOD99_2572 [Oopsacas minuta]|uniref:Uncharacterized protein n=1 Tax=Oopsacas minuta TaxID=111878 RepID=A0AAV7K0E7_9METZ|nr:hypothetical protein LOD99_2572 [Oopsacas minuta]